MTTPATPGRELSELPPLKVFGGPLGGYFQGCVGPVAYGAPLSAGRLFVRASRRSLRDSADQSWSKIVPLVQGMTAKSRLAHGTADEPYRSAFFHGLTPSFPVVPGSRCGVTVTGSAPAFAWTRT
ncbi:hypothetical protein GCM10009646_76730 [Streptomyces aureus]